MGGEVTEGEGALADHYTCVAPMPVVLTPICPKKVLAKLPFRRDKQAER